MKEDSGLRMPARVECVGQVKGGGYGAVPATRRAGETNCVRMTDGTVRHVRQRKSELASHAYCALERLAECFLF